jgi:hypothetical protein
VKKVVAFVAGDYAWAVVVRRRQDDPFGHVHSMLVLDTQRQALAMSRQIEAQIRHGDLLPADPTPHSACRASESRPALAGCDEALQLLVSSHPDGSDPDRVDFI